MSVIVGLLLSKLFLCSPVIFAKDSSRPDYQKSQSRYQQRGYTNSNENSGTRSWPTPIWRAYATATDAFDDDNDADEMLQLPGFRLVPNSVTLDDLERRNALTAV